MNDRQKLEQVIRQWAKKKIQRKKNNQQRDLARRINRRKEW